MQIYLLLQVKPNSLPVEHKFVKEEIENVPEAVLIERYMSPYAVPIIVVHRKSKSGAPLAETKTISD